MARPVAEAAEVVALAAAVRERRTAAVARALTLVESTRPADRGPARRLLRLLTPAAGGAHRVGVSGIPGAGKSTFIDALGCHLTARGHRVAVVAVDPSSQLSGGSLLGDRTRMSRLAADERAFIRPSPSGGTLGGVAAGTYDAITVLEAGGYDVVLVETVGVGQSESAVAALVDSFLLLTVPGTGDGLQALKMGVLELADVIAVNKADGANQEAARSAARELAGALRLLGAARVDRDTDVLTCSAADGRGIAEVWERLVARHAARAASGELAERRRDHQVTQLHAALRAALFDDLATDAAIARIFAEVRHGVRAGQLSPAEGAARVHGALRRPARQRPFEDVESAMPHDHRPEPQGWGVTGIDHVGVAVADLDEALTFYARTFGLRCVAVETNEEQGVREAMLQAGDDAGTRLQVLAPLSASSPIAKFLDRRGPGIQQLAYAVSDLDVAAAALAERGVKLLHEQHKSGTGGTRVNFIHPRDAGGVLVELVEHPRN